MSKNAVEEARAAAWRDQQVRRARAIAARAIALRGDPAAAARVNAAWEPLINRQEA